MRELDTLGMTPGIEGQSVQAAHEACNAVVVHLWQLAHKSGANRKKG